MLQRDQKRAQFAYSVAAEAARKPERVREGYRIAVNDLGANIVRAGFAAAVAALERRGADGGHLLLEHLGRAGIPHLRGDGTSLADTVRKLELPAYILATRETLKVAIWLKRAVQATTGEAD